MALARDALMPRPIHKGVVLPGDVARKGTGLTIIVPRGYESEQDRMADPEAGGYMVCRVLVDAQTERVCGRLFEPGEERAFQKHVGDCAREHIDQIRAGSPRAKMPVLDPNEWDPEIEEHMRKVGRRMIREGRLEVRKNERAGF